jgi:hypothetical protein
MLWWLAGQCAAVVAVFAIPLPRSWAIDRHRAALWLFAAQTPLLLIDVLDSTSVFIVAWLLRIRREEWEQKGKPGRTANVLQACGIGLGLALALALAMSFVVTDFLRRADGGPAGSFFEKNPALTPAAVLLEAGAAAVAGALMWLGHRRAVRTNDGRVLSRVAADLLGLMTAWPLLAVGPYILVFLTCA